MWLKRIESRSQKATKEQRNRQNAAVSLKTAPPITPHPAGSWGDGEGLRDPAASHLQETYPNFSGLRVSSMLIHEYS